MGILRTDRLSGLDGANAIKGSVKFTVNDGTGNTLGNSLNIVDANDKADLNFAGNDFTFEAWVYPYDNVQWNCVYSQAWGLQIYIRTSDSNGAYVFIYVSDADSSSYAISGAASAYKSITANQWNHIAFSRSGNSWTIFTNGTAATSSTSSQSLVSSNADYTIGIFNSIGSAGQDAGSYFGFKGYISNLRIRTGAHYLPSTNFTPPVGELQKTSDTVLLACQSPGDVTKEATGKTLVPTRKNLNDAFPQASRFTPNSPVGFSTTTDVGTQFGTTFDGVTTFDSQAYMVPPGGNTRERNRGRGVIRGGMTPNSSALTKIIQYIEMSSGGNTIDFGDGSTASYGGAGLASATRGVYSLGATANSSPFSLVNTLEFVTIANTANAIDFGDLYFAIQNQAPMSNQTRGIFAAGISPQSRVRMDFITIATTGNAQDFGDSIGGSYGLNQGGQAGSTTRGLIAGGSSNSAPAEVEKIQFVTFASLGDAQDFGDLVDQNGYSNVGASSGTRALFAGGGNIGSPFVTVNRIQFVTIASEGNATDFGDLTESRYGGGGLSNSTRGCFAGGVTYPGATRQNIIDFVNISTTGNAKDFGDIAVVNVNSVGTMSDSHGGLS